MALAYDPEIAKRDAQKFIEYHLAQKEYDNAFNLLGILNDSNLVLKFLLAIPETERHALIQKDTAIAAIMAKYYIEKNNISWQHNFTPILKKLALMQHLLLKFKSKIMKRLMISLRNTIPLTYFQCLSVNRLPRYFIVKLKQPT